MYEPRRPKQRLLRMSRRTTPRKVKLPSVMTENAPSTKKVEELYSLIEEMETAMMTTQQADGQMVTRPMATQTQAGIGDLYFVTDIDSKKVEDLRQNPQINLGYLNTSNYEWVSVTGTATISQDRAKIKELYQPDWKAWFGDEGGAKDGSSDDPRLALIVVDANNVRYLKAKHSKPVALFQIAKGMVTGTQPDLGREEQLGDGELPR